MGRNRPQSNTTSENSESTTTPQPPATAKKQKKERTFEVISTINLGPKGIREPGGEIREGELPAEQLQELLEAGRVRDADAPVPPSQAEGVAAFDRLLNVAVRIGAAKRAGSTYTLGEKSAKGLTAFRAAVSIAELEDAIVKAAE